MNAPYVSGALVDRTLTNICNVWRESHSYFFIFLEVALFEGLANNIQELPDLRKTGKAAKSPDRAIL